MPGFVSTWCVLWIRDSILWASAPPPLPFPRRPTVGGGAAAPPKRRRNVLRLARRIPPSFLCIPPAPSLSPSYIAAWAVLKDREGRVMSTLDQRSLLIFPPPPHERPPRGRGLDPRPAGLV